MSLEEIQEICQQFRAVTQDIKWGSALCFSVGSKMFLLTSPDAVPVSASFKVTAEDFELLTARPGLRPAPYLARNNWVQVEDISILSKKEWIHYLRQSYELVAGRLPAKLKKQLRLDLGGLN